MKWRHAVLSVGLVSAMGGAAAYSWPSWADSVAESEAREWLDRRFDDVVIGQFELERHRVTMRDVSFVDGGITARIDEVIVTFDLGWDRTLDVSEVAVTGGSVEATSEALLNRERPSEGSGPDAPSPRVRLDQAKLSVDGVRVLVSGEESSVRALVAGELVGDIVSLTLTDGHVAARGHEGSFAIVTSSFNTNQPFPLKIVLDGATAEVTPEIPVSAVAGEITVLDRAASSVTFDLHGLGKDGGAAWAVLGTLDRVRGSGGVRVETNGFELGQLPDFYAALPVRESESAKVRGSATIHWAGGVVHASGDLSVDGLTVEHPMLATTPIRDVSFTTSAVVKVIPSLRRIEIDQARLTRGKVSVHARGIVSDGDDERYDLLVSVPKVPCQDALEAVPEDLVPGLQGFTLEGDFEMTMNVVVVPNEPDSTVLQGDVGIERCKVTKVPAQVEALDQAFAYEVRRKDGVTQSLVLAEGSQTYTALEEIAPVMAAAVTTTEDGGFWKHDGFLRSQFEASLRRNVELGRIKRGASTLTMQMVKNVLLSHERTLSRKVQELFLTWVVEGRLSKKRILEIYLNVVEFGPGIYGVTAAAQHYFGKSPADLNGKEAAFLATMLPSPVRRHEQWCRGALTEKYAAKVDRVFKAMHDRRRIDDATWALDRDTPLVFDLQEWPGEKACRSEDAALLKATGVQWAESGLLSGRGVGVSYDPPSDELSEEGPGEL